MFSRRQDAQRQPTARKAAQRLEEEFGLALLDRLGRRVAVTTAGESVHRMALAWRRGV
ncbi:LysR family transcriptional regulator [Methylocella sp.]|uniref:LysR family transcriptional regulator n=1 Tax=Methylocella sp. TaxID=1978226 RepID=UPI00378442F7